MSLSVVLLCFLIPIALYAAVCSMLSFTVHHDTPALTWLVVLLGATSIAAVGYLAVEAARRRYFRGDTAREPYWYIFLATTMTLAYIFAIYLGFTNYWNNTLPYEDLMNLSYHPGVNPATTPGRQSMDTGRILFVDGTKLDISKSIGFKNVDMYCVAPITFQGKELESYDYWAIGLNCCSGGPGDFHCGEFSNPRARGGLRLMRGDQRSFYRLAVQQAEATYNIKADLPLFFYWMQEPVAGMDAYRSDAMRYFLLGLGVAFFCQLLLLVLAVLGHSKL